MHPLLARAYAGAPSELRPSAGDPDLPEAAALHGSARGDRSAPRLQELADVLLVRSGYAPFMPMNEHATTRPLPAQRASPILLPYR